MDSRADRAATASLSLLSEEGKEGVARSSARNVNGASQGRDDVRAVHGSTVATCVAHASSKTRLDFRRVRVRGVARGVFRSRAGRVVDALGRRYASWAALRVFECACESA